MDRKGASFIFLKMEDTSSSGRPAAPAAEAFCAYGSSSDQSFLVAWPPPPHTSASATFQVCGLPPWELPIHGAEEDRAASVSKSHSQAEKRRRDRINAQLGILRKFIPKSDKMDKAALLGSVINHVKDLKRKAKEASKSLTIPTEADEVTVDCSVSDQDVISPETEIHKDRNGSIFIRASLCCDDRPELFSELSQMLKTLKLSIVNAEVASVGGRVKSILVLYNEEGVTLSTIKQSLNVVLSRIASSSVPSSRQLRSKRQRFFFPSH